jgi:tetratricopeptide (TPR) repeat protein
LQKSFPEHSNIHYMVSAIFTPKGGQTRTCLPCYYKFSFLLVFSLLPARYANGQVQDLLKQFTKSFIDNYQDPRLKMAGNVYIPSTIKPELTVESAKKIIYTELDKWIYPIPNLKEPAYYDDSLKKEGYRIKDPIVVKDDYFEFNTTTAGNIRIDFADILFDEIVLTTPFKDDVTCRLKINRHNFRSCHNEFADALFYMRYHFSKQYFKEQAEAFKQIALAYQKMTEKPEISEEQRKYFIQGNAMAEAMQVTKGIEFYNKAIAINPVAYPAGYYNLACMATLIDNYPLAVCSMKKYLMLMPDADDAREAQDKIYEWEAFIK